MNRGLLGFLAFLTVLLLGLAVAAYVLGPNVLAFIFRGDRNAESVVIVDLLDFSDDGGATAYARDFEQPASAMIAALGGRTIWKARPDTVVRGQAGDAWSALELVAYPSRSAFIELVTSSDYRALLDARDAALKRSAVLAAIPVDSPSAAVGIPPFDADGERAFAVRFLTGAHTDSLAIYAEKWLGQDTEMLERHEGRLLWRARLNPLVADVPHRFEEMSIYGFSDVAHRDAWAGDDERETLQTLQRRLFRRDVLILADAEHLVNPPAAPDSDAAAPSDEGATAAPDRDAAADSDMETAPAPDTEDGAPASPVQAPGSEP